MFKIAIIQFPGINTEYETRREINKAGMRGEFFRWNEPPSKLAAYDGYVIGGGFAYEDRGRAGIIASLDPVMAAIKEQAAKGKPVLGICNGAQILVESGLIPGVDGNKLGMALARNKRIKNGEVLGTGYYNAWVHVKCTTPKEKCLFTWNFKEGEVIRAPVAHGEGRFTTEIPDLMAKITSSGQMAFRYCDSEGVVMEDFPVNPNGSQFSVAALCNPAGNVMAVMPHLERDLAASAKLFASLRDGLTARKAAGLEKKRTPHLIVKPLQTLPLPSFTTSAPSMQMFVSLIITDNEADTFELTLKNLGFNKVSFRRVTHFELSYQGKPDMEKIGKKLIQSGVLLNTNKEHATVQMGKEKKSFDAKRQKFMPLSGGSLLGGATGTTAESITMRLLVREKQDLVGLSKFSTIQKRLKMPEITGVKIGTLWEVRINTKSRAVAEDTYKKLLNTNLFFNPHRQDALRV